MDAHQSQSRRQLRPSVEGLESLRLLSGMAHAVAVHPVALVHAEATKTVAPVAVVDLHGTIHATARVSGSSLVITGSGNLGAVGTASINYHIDQNGSIQPSTITTKQDQITLGRSKLLPPSTNTNPVVSTGARSDKIVLSYSVIGGTGAYAHSTGSGTLTEAIALSKADRITVNLVFS